MPSGAPSLVMVCFLSGIVSWSSLLLAKFDAISSSNLGLTLILIAPYFSSLCSRSGCVMYSKILLKSSKTSSSHSITPLVPAKTALPRSER